MARKVKAKPRPEPTPSPEPEYTGSPRKSLPVPAAVVLEICKNSHPLDMLYLARTCSTLRRVLRERSSSSAWKQAFHNAGLPHCPDDIAGPHYAAMFYEFVCDACGTGRCKKGRRDVHWDVRRRLCVKCARKFLVGLPRICPGLPNGQLAVLVPTSGTGPIRKAYEPMLRKIMDEIQTVAAVGAAELAVLVNDLKKRLAEIESHSRECEQWNEDEAKKLIENEDIAIRQASVCSRLQNEGWADQLDIYRAYVLDHELVNQAKQLFDDDWELYRERIKGDAVAKWTAKHESKLLKQRKRERYRRWVLTLWDLHRLKQTLGDGGIWPDGNDLRRMPELQPVLDGVVVSADAIADGALADGAAIVGSLTGDRTQTLVDGDLGPDAIPPTAVSAAHSPGGQSDGASLNGDASDSASVGADDDSEIEEDDGDDSNQDDMPGYRDETHSDSEESILPPGHDPDALANSSDASDADSDADEKATGDSPSKVQEKAAISAAMDRLFPSALIAWRRNISLRLFNSIPRKTIRSIAGDIDTSTNDAKIAFLSRAATVFQCRGDDDLSDCWLSCGGDHHGLPESWYTEGQLVFYPEALEHRDVCALENLDRMWHFEERTDFSTFDSQRELRAAWCPDSLNISKEGSVFMKKLVQAAGLDHRTATRREMDELDARFVCKTCLDAPELDSEYALKVHNWLSCFHDAFPGTSHCGGQHPARFVRLTNADAEARTRGLAPRGNEYQPLSVALSELGFPRESLVG